MIGSINIVAASIAGLVTGLIQAIPNLVVAIIIWVVGVLILDFVTGVLRKIDIKRTRLDDEAVNLLVNLIQKVGRIMLFLIILDFLGIGRTFVAAIFNALSFAIAIAVGLSFGRALEPDALTITSYLRKVLFRGNGGRSTRTTTRRGR